MFGLIRFGRDVFGFRFCSLWFSVVCDILVWWVVGIMLFFRNCWKVVLCCVDMGVMVNLVMVMRVKIRFIRR